MIEYKLKHVGMNCENEKKAEDLLGELCIAFNLSRGNENDTHIFAGSLFEVMKHQKIGVHGHIAIQTSDVELAMEDLKAKGYSFQEESIRKNAEGKIIFVYLKEQIGGFAFHLTV